MQDPTAIPRDQRMLADAFIGLSGEEVRKMLILGQLLPALALANRPEEP